MPGTALRPLLPVGLLEAAEPVVLPGWVDRWPAVQAAKSAAHLVAHPAAHPAAHLAAQSPSQSPAPSPAQPAAHPHGVLAYLRERDAGAVVGAWRAGPQAGGRFDYLPDFSGLNFERVKLPLAQALDLLGEMASHAGAATAADLPSLYIGSTTVDTCLPGFRAENDLDPGFVSQCEPLVSLWLGNRSCVSPHQDVPDNLACVVAGRRRFTLFPPDQVANLYIGPLEHTLAGQPTSLVDHRQPDLQRFPRYAEALRHARVFELGPGDALFIPSLWWHGVEALDAVNLLVNYWWRQSPPHMDSPMGALLHALMTVRDLPPAQRAAWRALFDHYVFDADGQTAAHIPAAARDVLGPMGDATTRGLRARLIRRLNR